MTLIELLVAMGLTMIVMSSVIAIITVFLNDAHYDQLRDEAQDNARSMVDRISRELRTSVSPSAGSAGLLEKASSYDIAFQTVNPNGLPTGSTNAYNQMRVRYCLDGSQTLWRQSQTWTTSAAPAVPSTTACPSTDPGWSQAGGSPCCVELRDVTNEINGANRPLFTFGPTGWSTTSQIQEVMVNVITDLNPGHRPGPSPQLTSGIFLRNVNSPPLSSFTATWVGNGSNTFDVTLNGSGSSDPNGQTLSYQWYANGGTAGCASSTSPPSTGAISNGTTQVFDAGTFSSGAQETFSLLVTNTQGLTNCSSQTVTIK